MPSLLLTAGDPGWSPPGLDALTVPLAERGLIGKEAGPDDSFWPGSAFLDLVMFLGCSPQVALDPKQGADGQSVPTILFNISTATRFLSAAHRASARCSECRTPVEAGESPVYDEDILCAQCGRLSRVAALDWRQSAGFGRCFVEIRGIYPQEAVPSDKLLAILSGVSGDTWRYFFT